MRSILKLFCNLSGDCSEGIDERLPCVRCVAGKLLKFSADSCRINLPLSLVSAYRRRSEAANLL